MKSIENIEMRPSRVIAGLCTASLGEFERRVAFYAFDGDDVRVIVDGQRTSVTVVGETLVDCEARLRVESWPAWLRYVRVLAEHGYHPVTLGDEHSREAA